MLGASGLGGGSSDTISFTTDPVLAQRIADTLVEAHDVMIGKITIVDLGERAKAAGFWNGEAGALRLMTGQYTDENALRLWDETFVRHLIYERNPLGRAVSALPPGSVVAPADIVHGTDGVDRVFNWLQPMTAEQIDDSVLEGYKRFLAAQEYAGGPADPLFFLVKPSKIRAWDPARVGVVRATPIEGAHGYQVSSMGEWRTWAGGAVTVERAPALPSAAIAPSALPMDALSIEARIRLAIRREPGGPWRNSPGLTPDPVSPPTDMGTECFSSAFCWELREAIAGSRGA